MATSISNGGTLSKVGTTYEWTIAEKTHWWNNNSWQAGIRIALRMTVTEIDTSKREATVKIERVLQAINQSIGYNSSGVEISNGALNWLTSTSNNPTGYNFSLKVTSSDGKSHQDIPNSDSGRPKLKFYQNTASWKDAFTGSNWGTNDRIFKYNDDGTCTITISVDNWYLKYGLEGSWSNTIFDNNNNKPPWKINSSTSGSTATFKLPSIDALISDISISGPNSVTSPISSIGTISIDNATTYVHTNSTFYDRRTLTASSVAYSSTSNNVYSVTFNNPSNIGVTYKWTASHTPTFNSTNTKSVNIKFNGSYLSDTINSYNCTLNCAITPNNGSTKYKNYTVKVTKDNFINWTTSDINKVYLNNNNTVSTYNTSNLKCNITAKINANGKAIINAKSNSMISNKSTTVDVHRMIDSLDVYTQTMSNSVDIPNTSNEYPTSDSFNIVIKPNPTTASNMFWNNVKNNLSNSLHFSPSSSSYFTHAYNANLSNNTPYVETVTPNSYLYDDLVVNAVAGTTYSISPTYNYGITGSNTFKLSAKDWSITKLEVNNASCIRPIKDCYFDNAFTIKSSQDSINSGEDFSKTIYLKRNDVDTFTLDNVITNIEPERTNEILTADNFKSSNEDIAKVIKVTDNKFITVEVYNKGEVDITITPNNEFAKATFKLTITNDYNLLVNKTEPSSTYPLIDSNSNESDIDNDSYKLLLKSNNAHNGTVTIQTATDKTFTNVCNLKLDCNLLPKDIKLSANPTIIAQGNFSTVTANILPNTGITYTTVSSKYDKITNWNVAFSKSFEEEIGYLSDDSADVNKKKIYNANVNDTFGNYTAYVEANISNLTPNFTTLSNTVNIDIKKRGISISPKNITMLVNTNATATVTTIPTNSTYTHRATPTDCINVSQNDKLLNIKGIKVGYTDLTVQSIYNTNVYEDTCKVKVIKDFDEPQIVFPKKVNNVDAGYFSNHPKIVFRLPTLEKKLGLGDIAVNITAYSSNNSVVTDRMFSLSNNSELFSMYYGNEDDTFENIIVNAIDNDNCYCVFADNGYDYYTSKISYLMVTVQYITNTELCESKLTTLKVVKKDIPTLPKVNELMKASDLVETYNTIVYLSNQMLYSSTLSDYMYGLTTLGIKGEKIQVLPFYKLLKTLNKIITNISVKAYSCSHNNDVDIPDFLAPNNVRTPYYSTKIANKCSDLGIIPNSNDDYPIMVDDSVDTIYNNPNIINEFKQSEFYIDYTVSPLNEFNIGLSRL